MGTETGAVRSHTALCLTEKISTYIPELADSRRTETVSLNLQALLQEPCFSDPGPLARDNIHEVSAGAPVHPRFARYFEALALGWTQDTTDLLPQLAGLAPGNVLRTDLSAVTTTIVSGQLLRTVLQVLEERRSAGLLKGADAEERFAYFHHWLTSASGAEHMAQAHGTAYAVARNRARRGARNFMEILECAVADLPRLAREFTSIGASARLHSVAAGAGDNHADGRSVAILTFEDGAKVVFKPRNVQSDIALNSLIDWSNRIGLTDLHTFGALPCGQYGYVEFQESVGWSQADGNKQVRYFDQLGQLTAILFLLRASDIHFENIISSVNGPVVIDTETLLTPVPRRPVAYDDGAASAMARNTVLDSVLGIGILPTLVSVPSRDGAIDIGAAGYEDGQTAPIKTLVVLNEGRDDMHTSLRFEAFTRPNAAPASNVPRISSTEQRDAVLQGFGRVLRSITEYREELHNLIEELFSECIQRFVPSPTIFYSQLLRMATHPAILSDREAKAAVLYRVCLRESATSVSLADAELRQLFAGDVPYFTYRPSSTALSARGPGAGENWSEYQDFFAAPGLSAVHERLAGLNEEVIDEQMRMIDFAYVNKLDPAAEVTGTSLHRNVPDAASHSDGQTSTAARAVRMLLDPIVSTLIDSVDRQHPATWIEPLVTTTDQSQWLPGTLGYDLYGGTAGIALVLAAAGATLNEPRYSRAADRVLGPIERQLSEGRIEEGTVSSGGFTGMGGTVYAIAKAAAFQDIGRPLDVPPLLSALAQAGGSDETMPPDLTVGAVGALAAGLAARSTLPQDLRSACDESLRLIAKRAVAAVRANEDAVTFTGYAHGIAGMAPVLLRAGAALGDETLTELGLELFHRLEASRVSREDDWPRTLDDAGSHRSYSWCHGAPGILLAYAEVEALAPGTVPAGRIDRLTELTLARGLGNNPTLCHGDAGTLDVLLDVCILSKQPSARQLREIAAGLHRTMTASVLKDGLNRRSKYSFTSSLMVGTAGTAWSLLRGIDPQRFPSILRLG